MEEISLVLGIITNIFTIILLVVGITVGVKLIALENKADKLLDNMEEKVNSLNGIFNVINKFTSSMDMIGNKVTNMVANIVGKVFKRKKEENNYE